MGNTEKTTKRRFNSYRYWDIDALAWELNDMAKQGWRFTGFTLGLEFEKADCQDDFYAVEVFSKGNELDLRPALKTEEFAAYCEAAGWELVDSQQKLCVFRRLREDAKPIFTEQERFSAVKRGLLEQLFALIVIPILLVVQQIIFFVEDYTGYITEPFYFFFDSVIFIFLIYNLTYCVSAIRFLRQSNHLLKQGQQPLYGIEKNQKIDMHFRGILWVSVFLLTIMLVGLGVLGGVEWVTYLGVLILAILVGMALLMYLRPKKGGYVVFTVVFTLAILSICAAFLFSIASDPSKSDLTPENLPLKLEDIGAQTTDGSMIDDYHTKTILASDDSYSIRGDACVDEITIDLTEEEVEQYKGDYEYAKAKGMQWNNYSYEVYTSHYPKVLHKIWEQQIAPTEYGTELRKGNVSDAKKWGAQEIYIGVDYPEYWLLYDNQILNISCANENMVDPVDWNKDNINTMKTKLGVD